jgi:hypothetical protein
MTPAPIAFVARVATAKAIALGLTSSANAHARKKMFAPRANACVAPIMAAKANGKAAIVAATTTSVANGKAAMVAAITTAPAIGTTTATAKAVAIGDRRRDNTNHSQRGDRGGRDWGQYGRRDWRDDDNHRRDWDRNRHDSRYDRYRNSHRDFDRPRYSDWRHVRNGYYFDRGYASIVHGYYGRNYYWWSYDGWRRPYRRWSVGYYMPAWLYWEPLPWDLYYRLPPAPYGCRYVYADGDILLVAIATGIIIDALLYADDYDDDYYYDRY